MSETGKGAPERIWVLLKSGEAHFKKPTHFNADAPEYVHIDKVRELEAEVARLIRENAVLGSDGSAARKSAAKNLARAEAAEARLAPDGVAVAYARVRDKNNPHYEDVVSPNSQEAEMWAYDLIPLYAHPASDTALREALEALRNFANQYRSGAQGAWMDADAAKELAALIDAALNPTSEKTDGTA